MSCGVFHASMIEQIDLNAYCAGHLSGSVLDDRVIAFPRSFFVEAEALGASVSLTCGGFETVEYIPEEALSCLPKLAEAGPVHRVLEEIRKAPKDKNLLLKANGPYSILASLIEPKQLYRRLIKDRPGIHRALETITAGLTDYLHAAIACGVSIISLADPYANPQVLGEKRYREFAAPFLVTLMKNIASRIDGGTDKAGTVILHLCPHNSVHLARLGYLNIRNIAVKRDSYIDALIRPSGFKPGLTILGDQCVYAQNTQRLAALTFADPHSSFMQLNNFLFYHVGHGAWE
jgi:uroporphyrinogen-III decarboxylase